jgi:hydroxypyruvate reductase
VKRQGRLSTAAPLRAKARGLSGEDSLSKFDAYPLMDALGDAVVTGPTGNNLRDLRILLAW